MRKLIVSLCDYSGNWTEMYRKEGYRVIQVDPKLGKEQRTDKHGNKYFGITAQEFLHSHYMRGLRAHGVIMMPPCTHFTISGNRWWKEKDADGRTAEGMEIVTACLDVKDRILSPDGWWVLENPVGRLPTLFPDRLGKPKMYFHPHHYAGWADEPDMEAFTKKTGLWGEFNIDLPKNDVEPVFYFAKNGKRGSWMWMKLGGASERTKELRSMTPQGFSRAWFEANP